MGKQDKLVLHQQPAVKYSTALHDGVYTVIMVDPDAPSRQAAKPGKSWLHWMLTNVQGKDLRSGNFATADIIKEYAGPWPPAGTGFHRYYINIYKQAHPLAVEPPASRGGF